MIGLNTFNPTKPLILGTELVPATLTGTITSPWSVSGGILTRNGAALQTAELSLTSAISTTTYYRVQMTIANLSGDNMAFRLGTSAWTTGAATELAADGQLTFFLYGGGSSASLWFGGYLGQAGQATVSNISVRSVATA